MKRARILRLPESPVGAAPWNAPQAPDPTFGRELARASALGGGQAFQLFRIAVSGPQHFDVNEKLHRCRLPSPRMRRRIDGVAGFGIVAAGIGLGPRALSSQ